MSTSKTNKVSEPAKVAKVILRKPNGTKATQGWAGEVINPDGSRFFVPELFKDEMIDEELNMTKGGHMVKAISDATIYAAINKFDVSGIILKFGDKCALKLDDFNKACRKIKDAKSKAKEQSKGDKEAAKAAWDEVKEPLLSAKRRAMLAMEMLAEDILDGNPKSVIG